MANGPTENGTKGTHEVIDAEFEVKPPEKSGELTVVYKNALQRIGETGLSPKIFPVVTVNATLAGDEVEGNVASSIDMVAPRDAQELSVKLNRAIHLIEQEIMEYTGLTEDLQAMALDFRVRTAARMGVKVDTLGDLHAGRIPGINLDTSKLEFLVAQMNMFFVDLSKKLDERKSRPDMVTDLAKLDWSAVFNGRLKDIAKRPGMENATKLSGVMKKYFTDADNANFVNSASSQLVGAPNNDQEAIELACDAIKYGTKVDSKSTELKGGLEPLLREAMGITEEKNALNEKKIALVNTVIGMVDVMLRDFRDTVGVINSRALIMLSGGQPLDQAAIEKIQADGMSAYLKDVTAASGQVQRLRILTRGKGFIYVHPGVTPESEYEAIDKEVKGLHANGKFNTISANLITRQMMEQGLMDITNATGLTAKLRDLDGETVDCRIIGNVSTSVTAHFPQGWKMHKINPGSFRGMDPAKDDDVLLQAVLNNLSKWTSEPASEEERQGNYAFPMTAKKKEVAADQAEEGSAASESQKEEQVITSAEVGNVPPELVPTEATPETDEKKEEEVKDPFALPGETEAQG